MTNNQVQNDNQPKKKRSMTKRMMATLCICGGVLLGAGGAAGIATAAHHHDDFRVEAAQKKAKTSDIKIDQNAAIDKFNQKYQGKQISEVKLEDEHGKYVYEIKGFDDNKEYEVTVNAKTGKVISSEAENRDQGEQEYQLDTSKAISRDEASKIAEDAAKKGKSHEWELKQEKDKPVWEVKVVNGHQEKEVTIDANSQKVLSTKNDDHH